MTRKEIFFLVGWQHNTVVVVNTTPSWLCVFSSNDRVQDCCDNSVPRALKLLSFRVWVGGDLLVGLYQPFVLFLFVFYHLVFSLATKRAVESDQEHDSSEGSVTIHTPLLMWSKTKIIEEGLKLGVDFSLTHSCYDPEENGRPCQRCDSCQLRRTAFRKLGFDDDPAILRVR